MIDPVRTPFARLAAGLALDLAGLAGAGLITFGAEQVYRPAGFIVGGVLVLTGVWFMARKAG